MPFTIGKCKLFRIKHITLLEGETFLRNKHEIVFFEIQCTFFGRKENTINNLHLSMVEGIEFYALYKSKMLIIPCKTDDSCFFIVLPDEIYKKVQDILIQF